MKDIIITPQIIKREIGIFIACFILAFIINICAIVAYGRPWSELFTQIGYVTVIAVFLYLFFGLIRIIIRLIVQLVRRCIKK
jgi:hypothetical protein